MQIFDHVSKTKIDVSLNGKTVKLYVCGPTVYNHVHVGNIRPIITFDVLNRLLTFLGYNVIFVHNITDIDDKIIAKAIEEKRNELELSNFYYEQYMEILFKLNIKIDNVKFPKVSENINEIEEYIQKIINNGFAYEMNGDVYFQPYLIKNYGYISNKNINDLEDGEISLSNSNKRNEKDFVLWKKTNIGLNWETKFSKGRPGWHTECSCLINKYFEDQCDIHGGGIDLKFPHHENENAQNIALNSKPISRIWMHVGHLNINDQKMSKSLNNFLLAKDILNEFDSNVIRWFFYQTNYTNPINFSKDSIEITKNNINNIIRNLNVYKSYILIDSKLENEINTIDKENIKNFIEDFNFPNFVTSIENMMKKANNYLRTKHIEKLKKTYLELHFILKEILGLMIPNIHDEKALKLLKKWNEFKNNKDYENADKYREILIEKNLI